LGFQGRKAIQMYLQKHGAHVCEYAVRQWFDSQVHWALDQGVSQQDAVTYTAKPSLTRAELRMEAPDRLLHKWHYVDGLTRQNVLERVRAQEGIIELGKGVSYTLIAHFFERVPLRTPKYWQHLLEDSILPHLCELKCRYDGHSDHSAGVWHAEKKHQPFLKSALWKEYAVRCEFPVDDLFNVWGHVCANFGDPSKAVVPVVPYMAVMCCAICGYYFPAPNVVMRKGRPYVREAAYVWDCEGCGTDGGMSEEAANLSYRTKWRQMPSDHHYWMTRYTKRSLWEIDVPCRSKHHRVARCDRSLAALFARRGFAQGYDIRPRGLNRYEDLGPPAWTIHDELFYFNGFDVPLPHFLQTANRAAWLRVPESELAPRDQIKQPILNSLRHRAVKRKSACATMPSGRIPEASTPKRPR
jgi:hypothetical protein